MAAHAQIRFPRLNAWPAGIRYRVLWNGRIADNGDGLPPADPDEPVDEEQPLTPAAIEVWPTGKAGDGFGPDGSGPDGLIQNWTSGFGDGYGIDGGEDGLYNDYVTWATRSVLPTLRDGTYKFAVRFEDRYGTVQEDALVIGSIAVAGVPRPPSNVQFEGWNRATGKLSLSWQHSPDLLA